MTDDDPMDILRRRFAEGEIDEDEFARRRGLLDGEGPEGGRTPSGSAPDDAAEPAPTTGGGPDEQAAERIREKRDMWERLAKSDLPIAEDAQRALDWLDRYERGEQ